MVKHGDEPPTVQRTLCWVGVVIIIQPVSKVTKRGLFQRLYEYFNLIRRQSPSGPHHLTVLSIGEWSDHLLLTSLEKYSDPA